eukprot:SAG31_NODE_41106_length_277_cov_1.438202_1_plen_35_part_10
MIPIVVADIMLICGANDVMPLGGRGTQPSGIGTAG